MSPGDIPRYDNAFLQGLQEQGYILAGEISRYDSASWQALVKRGRFEGKKLRMEIRASIEDYPKRVPAIAKELVGLNPDLVFAASLPEAAGAREAVRRAGKSTPVVFGPTIDPVGGGLVDSLARPGANVTGLLLNDPELDAKRFEILTEAFPTVSRVAYLHEPLSLPPTLSAQTKSAVRTAAQTNGVEVEILDVKRFEDVPSALAQTTAASAQALMVMISPILLSVRQRIADFSAQRRLPAIYGDAIFLEAGGLMFYGTPYVDLNRRAAAIVAKILGGANPSDIPVEQPTELKLMVNMKAARVLNATIPESVRLRAEIVEY
jgi:putative ABC transport system substrate-binding protein